MNKFIGTKEFYKNTLKITIPILVQNLITAFVSMLDNIMVGRLGTDPMSGVAIVNQLIFVFNLLIFGSVAGAGIFCAQFYGKRDVEGIHQSFRYKLYSVILATGIAVTVFCLFGKELILLYLHDGGGAGNLDATLTHARSYLTIMLAGLLPFAVSQAYASTLRECSRIKLPMFAGIVAVLVNTVLNYILIFGKFGFPQLGAVGAAIATVISRFVECGIIMTLTHIRTSQYPFAIGFYKSLKIKKEIVKKIFVKGTPLLCNEVLWGAGMAIINQCYSCRGLSAVAAININSTIYNLFNVIYLAMGSTVAIIIGQLLGAGKTEEAKRSNTQLIVLSVGVTAIIGVIMACMSGVFPMIYNTEAEVRELARNFILISSVMLPLQAYVHTGYFTLRSGGRSGSVLIVDSGFMYVLVIPLSFVLSRLTNLPATPMYFIIQAMEIFKCLLIGYMLHQGKWAQNIVADKE